MIKFLKTTLYNPLRHFSADMILSSSLIRKRLLRSKKGNTLSETMIAMVILGVVFTISIGTFIADYNKNQTVIRLQKIFSVIQQAMNIAVINNGTADTWNFPEKLSEQGTYYVFEKYIKPNFILARDCKNSTEDVCDYNFKELDGTEKSLNSTWSRFYLNDGTFIALQAVPSNDYKVIYFYVDTNGKKRLNVVARDIFLFEYWIQNDENPDYIGKLLPYGHQYSRSELISTSNENNCNSSKNGNYCSALILKDDWQITKGYPWAQARYVIQ